ncbi:MAG: methionyl-tRNA formyltransferase [Peptoniphilus sp.]|nr:methionyl-tRNA formyltransferase [Peptoniphilus sp.]MDD7362942.1 methionyl-tRNA formyltransferase [Bacillota bacterium]MDY6044182.1 methionyl-tRNA formyltransferase [Peptoniphilus sp.]
MKSVFFGTPEFALPTLEALNEYTDLALVVTQEDRKRGRGKKVTPTPVKARAQELGIEVFQPEKVNDEASLEKLRSVEADLFIVVAYGQILSQDLIDIPKKYIMNVHSSLLPKYRGAAPMQWAILNGDETTGVSLMQVEKGLDSGAVYAMRETPIGDKNFGAVHDELALLGADLLKAFIDDLEHGEVAFKPQDDAESTYAPKIDDALMTLDPFEQTAEEFVRKVRAFSPEPGAHLLLLGERLKVYDALVSNESLQAGEFLATKKKLSIGTREGSVSIRELQRPGKKRMPVGSYLAGAHLPERGEI